MSKVVIAKYSRGNDDFEILVDADLAYEYITGVRSDPLSVLETEEVFKDAKKGEKQSDSKIAAAFGTSDLAKVVDAILKKGHVPITSDQQKKLAEEKKKQVIDIISRNSIDPRTNTPNPPLRVANAIEQAKIYIDPMRSASDQIEEIVKKLSTILPIKFTNVSMDVTVPPEFANRCFGTLKHYNIKSEKWLSDGSLQVSLEFPAGLRDEFFDKINALTQGKAQVKITS
ncbi:MAG: ribosome assembly factor SBDS [Candidatus Marsarchaeota archaeon]|jgi:ribosome maturation protein SDO1|nr:ribosome assembly factor SBDS [Candidatus Marsarchaeota archaeon]MCL5112651.1 ribosome assembly factor SBDS [Candidatus Marsarchaeota archaeon]